MSIGIAAGRARCQSPPSQCVTCACVTRPPPLCTSLLGGSRCSGAEGWEADLAPHRQSLFCRFQVFPLKQGGLVQQGWPSGQLWPWPCPGLHTLCEVGIMVPLARLLMGGHVYTSGVLPFLRGSSHLAPGVPSHLVIIHDPHLYSLMMWILPPSPAGLRFSAFLPPADPPPCMAGIPRSAELPFPHWARKSRRWWSLACRGAGRTAQEGRLHCSSEPPGNITYPPAGTSRSRACRRPPAFLRLCRCFSLEVICKGARRTWSGRPS